MILTLALRHLLVRRVRALVLLAGFALGVGVMIVLLSVGEAMVAQSRDVALVGGGEVTVLPQGIDVEAMRTGGMSGMFFGIDRARFVTRQLLGGPRHASVVRAVSPVIEYKLLYLRKRDRLIPVRAGGEVPSRTRAVGSGLEILDGAWDDSPADSAWIAPSLEQRYHELDRFHLPPVPDSTWAEWQYFNVVVGPEEWWYVTYIVGGEVPDGRWGGQLLITRRRPDGRYEKFTATVPANRVRFDTTRADVTLGASTITQHDGVYTLTGTANGPAGAATVELVIRPDPARYFPPVELRSDHVVSGYVVPALRAEATGTLCVNARCARVTDAPAYHDHNWGTWRDVTWEWGTGRGARFDLLYGGVLTPGDNARGGNPFFLALADSAGVNQVLRFASITYQGRLPAGGFSVDAPERLTLVAARDADTVRLHVDVSSAQATTRRREGYARAFLQLRGRYHLEGVLGGERVTDTGDGFFETYVPVGPVR